MRKIFQFFVIFGLFWCFISNEALDEENAEPSDDDGEPTEPSGPVTINIGALFDVNVDENQQIFQYAIEMANEKLLANEGFHLNGESVVIDFGNELNISQSLCGLFEKGVSAIIGPNDEKTAVHAENICDTMEIPFIDTRNDVNSAIPVVSMYADSSTLGQMITDLIQAAQWQSFTILYETPEWLPHLSNLLELYDPKGDTVTVKRIDVGLSNEKNYRSVLRAVKQSSDNCIIIECSIENLGEILKQAQQVGLLVDNYQILLTNLDAHTIDLEPYQHGGANITTLRMVDATSESMTAYTEYMKKAAEEEKKKKEEEEKNADSESNDEENPVEGGADEPPAPEDGKENTEDGGDEENEEKKDGEENEEEKAEGEEEEEEDEEFNPDSVRLQTALIHDGIVLLADTFKQLGVDQIQPISLVCLKNESTDSADSTWEKGLSISNFMRNTIIDGMTKNVKFDANGRRSEITVQISSLTTEGSIKIGTWDTEYGVKSLPIPGITTSGTDVLRNRTFIVLISITPPYGMLKEAATQLIGNDRFEGFGVDIIHELSEILGFKYEFRLENSYGNKHPITKEWNGMIRQLQDDIAHLAITDLTITAERESGADFTMPFMNLGIALLYKKPTKAPPSTFSFLAPFTNGVWIFLAVAYFTVSLCLYVLGRLSPSEWDNPYPCIEDPEELENQFTFANSMWFCIGALLQQGSEIAPKAPATRFTASMWWFFTLIMVSSYTANLAAFLTVQDPFEKIKSVDDLEKCGESDDLCPVQFGAKKGGATFNFFKDSDNSKYRNMYKYMERHPELMPGDNDVGVGKACDENEDYAFLMESSSIEYVTERHCEVTQIGGLLDDKGYGIAMKKDAEYRNDLSEGILQLQESGKLAALKIKWWKEKRGGGACQDAEDDGGGAVELEMANVVGVFYVLVGGSIFALIFAFTAILLEALKIAREMKKPDSNDADPLLVQNVNGVFIVLFVGCGCAITIGYIEFIFVCFKNAKKFKVPFKEEFIEEMKFILKFEGNTKEVRHRKSESGGSENSVKSYPSNESGIAHAGGCSQKTA